MKCTKISSDLKITPLSIKETYEILNPSLIDETKSNEIRRQTYYTQKLLKTLYNTNDIKDLEIYIHSRNGIRNERGDLYITSKTNNRKVIFCTLRGLKWILEDIKGLEVQKKLEYTNELMLIGIKYLLDKHMREYVMTAEELPDGSNHIPGMKLTNVYKYNKSDGKWNDKYIWKKG